MPDNLRSIPSPRGGKRISILSAYPLTSAQALWNAHTQWKTSRTSKSFLFKMSCWYTNGVKLRKEKVKTEVLPSGGWKPS